MDSYPLAVGVVSVEPRVIPHRAGILGCDSIVSTTRRGSCRVFPGSAAAKAGILVNDLIPRSGARKLRRGKLLVRRVQEFSPGDPVGMVAKRGDEQLDTLGNSHGPIPGLRPSRNEIQNMLGGGLSERRFGFASAFQHDTVIEPTEVGGPVVNLDGEVVGFNIARSGRTETYAIAADSLAKVVKELMVEAANR